MKNKKYSVLFCLAVSWKLGFDTPGIYIDLNNDLPNAAMYEVVEVLITSFNVVKFYSIG